MKTLADVLHECGIVPPAPGEFIIDEYIEIERDNPSYLATQKSILFRRAMNAAIFRTLTTGNLWVPSIRIVSKTEDRRIWSVGELQDLGEWQPSIHDINVMESFTIGFDVGGKFVDLSRLYAFYRAFYREKHGL